MARTQPRLGTDMAAGWQIHPSTDPHSDDTPRVLLESHDGAEAHALWRLLNDRGYDVSWCQGPPHDNGERCPLVRRGRCDLVEQADVVVCSLGLGDPATREVLAGHRRHHPGLPVIVSAPQPATEQYAAAVADHRPLRSPLSAEAVVAAIDEACAAAGTAAPTR